jgi:hypothetical protein
MGMMKKQYVNKQYTVSIVLGVCFAAIGALIPSLISMPVEAPAVDCNETPFHPDCIPRETLKWPPDDFGCKSCPWHMFDLKDWLIIDHDWTVNTSVIHGPNSTTLSVTIPNVLIDAMKTKMETANLQQNLSMAK